jgi:hypothetical protein
VRDIVTCERQPLRMVVDSPPRGLGARRASSHGGPIADRASRDARDEARIETLRADRRTR